ncbi:hypothetical protein Pyn_19449 [Prunus yedoensis var. nudiflora]|uniref:Uncharacterized protein n=1 Tax=Prunus yedoensis var. nudiflora TaxID=2094558 RepID=A0A315AT77_PRUYE|nr:hypothetical protein Pyn_19449 [Prunus yedoensis var. nudiflora]
MEDGNPVRGLKMVAMRKGSCHGQREGDGERGELGGLNRAMEKAILELGDLNGATEMVISASSVEGAREMCFIDVRES